MIYNFTWELIMDKILFNTIESIKNNIYRGMNEARTTCLINGILHAYGWNVFDPYEVMPQDRDYSGKRPDLTLKIYGNRNAFIEIKSIDENLIKHVEQLKGYFKNNTDVKYGFLTNARFWWFYTSYLSENNDLGIIKEAEIDLINDTDFNIETFFSECLNKDKLTNRCYEDYMNKLASKNVDNFQKTEIISILRSKKDKRVIEPLKKIFLNEKEHEWLTRCSDWSR